MSHLGPIDTRNVEQKLYYMLLIYPHYSNYSSPLYNSLSSMLTHYNYTTEYLNEMTGEGTWNTCIHTHRIHVEGLKNFDRTCFPPITTTAAAATILLLTSIHFSPYREARGYDGNGRFSQSINVTFRSSTTCAQLLNSKIYLVRLNHPSSQLLTCCIIINGNIPTDPGHD